MAASKATLKDWILVTRPWSVTAPLVPFLVGAGSLVCMKSIEEGGWIRWGLGLMSGILLVLACNLFNTWGDERSGVDRMPGAVLTTPQIQAGLISLRAVFIYGAVLFFLSGTLGIPTLFYYAKDAWHFNVPLLVAAVIGFLGAVNYSTGIKYKYLGLGVPMVAFLEGFLYVFVVVLLLAPYKAERLCRLVVAGRGIPVAIWFLLVSLPVASLVGVILHGNDMRDISTDNRAGVRSLASCLGTGGSLFVFCALHLLAYCVPLGMCLLSLMRSTPRIADSVCLLPFVVLPLTLRLLRDAVRDYRENPSCPAWLNCEKGSGKIHFLFGLFYSISLALWS